MTLSEYIDRLNTRYKAGISREHSYRGDLQNLLESLAPDVLVTNEPARIACGAPDYILTKKGIPVGYIEAKDIGVQLSSKSLKEQFERYRASLDNLIITDYMDFHLYIEGEFTTSVRIAEIQDGQVRPIPDNYTMFENLMKDFCTFNGQTIKSSRKLAEMMAGKARMLSEVIGKALNSDEENRENSTLQEQMEAFRQVLLHDIKTREFADIYAQTIAYGMFAARLHDPTLPTFTRQEAAQLIPKSNPFLRTLFQYIAGYDLDSRITWIVDGLADLFRATDVAALLKNFGKATQTHDPIIHFYETFLAEYDPKLRKARGVWYTPESVVQFIVRAVDDILKTEFSLPQGLADTSKTKVTLKVPTHDKRFKAGQREYEQEVHKVQILDPATGTGTFLAEVVKHVHSRFKGQQGIWSNYVENHLIPRLNGFELLMASYAMAHLKLDLLLTETGYKPTRDQRFRVYLTNSLEEHHPDTGSLFATALANEANEANHIKRDTPVMVVMGNPPYSVSSTNKSEWIERLVADYKKNLNERNIQPLSDDYIKFIRFGQHFIDKNGEGVLAYISNNSFIEGLIHRQMRKSLLESFDKVYILDLHGNSKKKEVAPDGSADQNVFDIMQGVSINLLVKTGKKQKKELGEVYRCDLWGKRDYKYEKLSINSLGTIAWEKLVIREPDFFFVNKNLESEQAYKAGFSISDLFQLNASGMTTERDHLTIQFDEAKLHDIRRDIQVLSEDAFRKTYTPKPDGRDWKVSYAKNDLATYRGEVQDVLYRPFDIRKTIYTGRSKGFMAYPRNEVMQHMLEKENLALLACRQQTSFDFQHVFISKNIVERCTVSLQTGEVGYAFPLYLYAEHSGQTTFGSSMERTPNLRKDIVQQIEERMGMKFTPERSETENTFAPIDILDYIYAVLHSPSYRKRYKEFLKVGFPRVPFPSGPDTFWKLVELGGELRQVHLLESRVVGEYITQYPEDGSNLVEKLQYVDGNVYINDTQYFADVPQPVWEFYIGGYQPAQKWLKDRKGRELGFDEILHYQKIIVALNETDRLMKEIDKIRVVEAQEVKEVER
ncbi:type ISP restriction/modification enzyme [uncultured Pontibacter sp.]|uniref:type ISP restriction/modification enzyme n=1 Tax=uncultured Pontibacter sp. TaxID=453356 RepID=UPI002628AFFE|nr:type ISP restriction/modification enzyme [uncultured Pontibacter sp.]